MSEPMLNLSAEDLADHLRKAVQGHLRVSLLDPKRPWGYSGDVSFMIGGWEVTFFNDCSDLDYVDRACTLDGRASDFEYWATVDGQGHNPLDHLTREEQSALSVLLEQAQ